MGSDTPDTDEIPEIHDLWRVWVTPDERKRCTYVTRDEQPMALAGVHDNRVTRF